MSRRLGMPFSLSFKGLMRLKRHLRNVLTAIIRYIQQRYEAKILRNSIPVLVLTYPVLK